MTVDRLTNSLMQKKIKKEVTLQNHQEIINMLEEQERVIRGHSEGIDGQSPRERETLAKYALIAQQMELQKEGKFRMKP